MNKYFQTAFFILLVGGLMLLFARLGLHHESWFVNDSYFLKIGLLGVCVFMIGISFILVGFLFGNKE